MTFQLAACAEMLWRDKPMQWRVKRLTEMGFQVGLWNWPEHDLAQHLSTAGMPEVDLLIRTGGESRMSNFMLWQMAYTELYFTDLLWPEFTPESLDQAIGWFAKRDRRFGGESTIATPAIESKAS